MLENGVVPKLYEVVVIEKMKIKCALLLTLFLVIVSVYCDATDSEVKATPKTLLPPQTPKISTQNNSVNVKSGGSDSNLDSLRVDLVNKGKDQVGGSSKEVDNIRLDKNNSSEQIEPKEAQIGRRSSNNNDTKEIGEIKKKVNGGSETKEVPKEGMLQSIRKENPRSEECDATNQCKAEKNALIACLRVPGNESPDLSLLVQNKGKGPLNVNISAPDFVWLEKTQIQLQEKEDVKVKVSIRNGGADNLIVLTAGNGNCNLDFRDLVAHSSIKGADYTSKSTYIKLYKRIPFGFLFVAVVIMALIATCVSYNRRRHLSSSSPKYQKLDMELPVSGGPKMDSKLNDGWDHSWNDGWGDDEEAPSSMPVTPSLSSQGVSSRRVKKDGWKD
ncbi:hypothetical protein LguiA_015767 [Lonicera macranthoides]